MRKRKKVSKYIVFSIKEGYHLRYSLNNISAEVFFFKKHVCSRSTGEVHSDYISFLYSNMCSPFFVLLESRLKNMRS